MKLWHHDFWRLAIANMLLTMSVYMLIPVLPLWLHQQEDAELTAWVMGVYGIGLFVMGPICNYLVQRYRRNQVCLFAVFLMLLCLSVFYLFVSGKLPHFRSGMEAMVLRFGLGLSFGLAQMILMSTLIIDICESFQRTEANHSASWFGRFGISLGPAAALIINHYFGMEVMVLSCCVTCLLAMLLIQLADFPFKAPEENVKIFSLDRFFLPDGWLLFINLLLVTTIAGLLFTTPLSYMFYSMMMGGFLLALLSEKFVFVNADLKSETVSGLVLMIAALLMMNRSQTMMVNQFIPPVFFGFGIGIIGSRFLLFFIKLSRHCQRGTSQSTFFLAWELGISMGLFLGYSCLSSRIYYTGIVLAFVALLMYVFVTHPWYMRNKNR